MTNPTQTPVTFDFNGHTVRAFNIEGQPWLVARDVCAALGLKNTSQAVAVLADDEKAITNSDSLGGVQRSLVVTEGGLYSLTFASRKPDALAFQKWVTGTVLPAIREDGMYVAGEEHAETEEDLDALALRAMEGMQQKIARQAAKLAEQAPKVAEYDLRFANKDAIGLTEYARQAGLKPNKFTAQLRDMSYLYNRGGTKNIPYAEYVDTLFIRRDTPAGFGQTLLSQEGCEHFATLIARGVFDAIKAAGIH